MRYKHHLLAGLSAMTAIIAAPAAAGEDPSFDRAATAVQERMALIDAVPGRIPGRTIVMVKSDGRHIVDAQGVTRQDGGTVVTEDTPFYIASMTKAFVGLMAVRLDQDGTFPLETTLAEVFPEMAVEGVDMSQLTMRRLLNHQLGFQASPLTMRTAYTDRVKVADYSAIINAAGVKIDKEFRYSNLGYVLYGAALEKRTGRAWRAWIEDTVFEPLNMQHTSARTSDFAEVSNSHYRSGGKLTRYQPKVDEVMHAAGGLVISARDMSRWLSANTGAASVIDQSTFVAAQTRQVDFDMRQGPMRCTGYSFGWRQCSGFGLSFLEHGGTYTGMRSQMVIVPEHGVGFAAMFNSDSMTGGLGGQLMLTFLAAYAGQAEALPPPAAFAEMYGQRVARLDAGRVDAAEEERGQDQWGGWQWQPTVGDLALYTGTYSDPALGILEVGLVDGAINARLNGMPATLEPAKTDVFGAVLATDYEIERMDFERNGEGAIDAVNFLGRRFVRQGK